MVCEAEHYSKLYDVLPPEANEAYDDPLFQLDFGWFVGTNSSLAAALWSQFPGTNRPHPPGPSTNWLQQFPGWPGGQRERALSGSGPVPGGLSPPPTPAGGAALGPRARSQPGPRPRAAPPAAPRKPQRRPAAPPPRRASWKSRTRDPRSNGAAGNWALNFLRPDPGWGRLVGGAGKRGLPPSCFRPGVCRI